MTLDLTAFEAECLRKLIRRVQYHAFYIREMDALSRSAIGVAQNKLDAAAGKEDAR